ncbi:MAG: hypothetical protein WDM86_16985 [Rhizomicrobium sp.]
MQAYSFRISVSGLARRLGVSRIHIPTLLQDADRAGYLRWNARTRELAFTPPLVAALESYYGRLFLFIGFFATQFVAMGGVRTGWAIAFEVGPPIVSRNAAMSPTDRDDGFVCVRNGANPRRISSGHFLPRVGPTRPAASFISDQFWETIDGRYFC